MITVVLNVYNRPYTLEAQIKAIKEQTVKVPDEDIWIWYNKGDVPQPVKYNSPYTVFITNRNFKFHGRFTPLTMAHTKYIAMFDDDVIPGKKWFENCLKSIEECNGILGSSGVNIMSKGYVPNYKIGWNGKHSDKIERADLVGHGWFFKQDWVKHMWAEEPVSWDNGEDIMFSYLCQKYGNINTFVPPHPENDVELWGNVPGRDRNWGSDANASYIKNNNHTDLRNQVCATCIENGWKTVHHVNA